MVRRKTVEMISLTIGWSVEWIRKRRRRGGGQPCCTASSCPMKRRRRSRYWLYSSMSLCPAPSTQRGSTALGQRSNKARPWEKSITSSSVPWMMSTGEVILDTFSMLKWKVRKIEELGIEKDKFLPHEREKTIHVFYKNLEIRIKWYYGITMSFSQ